LLCDVLADVCQGFLSMCCWRAQVLLCGETTANGKNAPVQEQQSHQNLDPAVEDPRSSRLERLQYNTRKIRASHIVAVLPDPIELRGEALNVACENDKGDGKAVPGASSRVWICSSSVAYNRGFIRECFRYASDSNIVVTTRWRFSFSATGVGGPSLSRNDQNDIGIHAFWSIFVVGNGFR